MCQTFSHFSAKKQIPLKAEVDKVEYIFPTVLLKMNVLLPYIQSC